MTSFDWKKSIEDSIKDGLIITVAGTGIFFPLKAANERRPKASRDAIDIMKLTGGICGRLFVKDYAVYKKWINEWYNNKILWPMRAIKLDDTDKKASVLFC